MLDQSSAPINLKKADKITMAVIGLIVVAAIAIPVLTWLDVVMGLLASVMENTIYFLGTAGALVLGGLWLLENRTALLYKWKNMARNLRRAIARENPIGVMDTAISRFAGKLEDISQHITRADAARKQQAAAIDTMRGKARKEQELADAANRTGKTDTEVARYATAADRWNTSADKLEPMAEMLANVHAKMLAAREVCLNRLEDMKNQREVFKLEYDTMMSGQKAIKSFKTFFGANPDLEMLQLSIEQIDEQTAIAEAEIDQFMHDIQPALDTAKLEKDAAQQKALDRMRPTLKAVPTRALTEGNGGLGLSSLIKEGEVVPSKKVG